MEVATKGTNAGSYPLSKVAVIEMVKDLAWAWGEKGARIASISQGTINTAMGRAEKEESDMMAVLLAHTPLRRESEAASYVTGIDILVDGGTIANMARMKASMQR